MLNGLHYYSNRWTQLAQLGGVAGSCEHGNERPGTVRRCELSGRRTRRGGFILNCGGRATESRNWTLIMAVRQLNSTVGSGNKTT